MTTILTCLFFTALVAVLTWWTTRGKGSDDEAGYFLAGRSLTGIFIAGSLLLTNLSTEQLVGLNGDAFKEGLSVMAWEVIAGMSLIVLGLYFLPRYLKSGIATIPQFLEERYGASVRALTTFIFIVAYMLILLPFVLFLGARGLSGMLDLQSTLGLSEVGIIWAVVIFVAVVGAAYAIFGGLRAVAVSDTYNGAGLLVGGLMITYFALKAVAGDGSIFSAFGKIEAANPDAFNSLGKRGESVHWPTLFSGVLLLNFFYWCTNQQIIQRTFGAKNLAEGQKGVLLAAFFKILAPIILVIPGIAAAHLVLTNPEFAATVGGDRGKAYGSLVHHVLPVALTGFFAAVVIGSILSTFNSVLNSSATLYSIGVYKKMINRNATPHEVVKSGRVCSFAVAIFSTIAAPTFFIGREELFSFFQSLNGIYFIPLLAIILVGMFNRNVDGRSAFITTVVGLVAMGIGTFFTGAVKDETGNVVTPGWLADTFGSGFHYMGAVFAGLVVLQLALGTFMRRATPYVQQDAKLVDLTPWKYAKPVGAVLFCSVIVIYLLLADFSVLKS